MNNETKLAGSWFIWGLSYYLYYPFVSLFVIKFISDVTLVYLISTLFAIPMPLIGAKLTRKIGLIKTIELGSILSGLGLILFSFSENLVWLIITYTLSSAFFITLPSYYSYMNNLGKGVIAKLWAISIIPSLFIPSVGGLIASFFGLRTIFLLGGILMILTFLPIAKLEEIEIDNEKIKIDIRILFPILVILPIALTFPYIYLILREKYFLSYGEIGFLATIAEIIGAVFTFIYSRFTKRFLLSLYLVLFSLVYLTYYSFVFSIFFGLWESLIPTALEESKGKTPEAFGIINSLQQAMWEVGYLVSYFTFSPRFSILISSLLAIILSIIFLLFKK
ncbi:hypothetical protein SJAV_17910 [Sulfurisphaera javensis]|uniref:MFS transporter n=1 Tax=Sulfurisphaera javensis TaxID=2049879 RepID=A0AAT9GSF9_9CREN